MGSLKWLFLGAAVLSQSGCLPRLKAFLPGDPVPQGNVVLVGRLVMDPFVVVDTGPAWDVGAYLKKVNLLFTDKPDSEVTRAFDADFIAQAPQGNLLAVVAPRRVLHVRGLQIVASIGGGGFTSNGTPGGPSVSTVQCLANMTIEPKPEDQVIYIGVLFCHHDRPTPVLRVYDEWKDFEPKLRGYTDTSKVKMRFPKAR